MTVRQAFLLRRAVVAAAMAAMAAVAVAGAGAAYTLRFLEGESFTLELGAISL